MNNLIFNPTRFTQLLQMEFLLEQKRLLIIAAGGFGLMILFAFFMIYTSGGYEHLNFNLFAFVLIVGGAVFTSLSFHEFNDKIGTHHYLSLPASTLEKFVSKWFFTAILFPFFVVIIFWIYTKVGDSYYNQRHDLSITTWTLNNYWSWFFIKLYLAGQSIYLLGAIVFQKYTYFKTSLAGFIAAGLFGLICMGVFRIFFAEYFESFWEMNHHINIGPNESTRELFQEGSFERIAEYALFLLLPIIMLVAGFFKLKEKEA